MFDYDDDDYLDYMKIHRQHRGSSYSRNSTTGLSRTGYTFTNPQKGRRYVTLLQNFLYKNVMTPYELFWYTYHSIKEEPAEAGAKKGHCGNMSDFYAALHEKGYIEYSQSRRLWRITEKGIKYCHDYDWLFEFPNKDCPKEV